MSRLQSIYEYFSNCSEEKINAVINSLSEEEKITYTKQLFGKLEAMKEKFEKKSKSRNSDK